MEQPQPTGNGSDDFHMPLSELRNEWKRIRFLCANNMLGESRQVYLQWYVAERRSYYWRKRALEAERKLTEVANV